jgi:hypothetical protein
MSSLDKAFREAIEKNASKINYGICDIIDRQSKICPECEGVPCQACLEFAYQIMLEKVGNVDED